MLRNALEMGEGEVATKSGLMVGFGETHDEMVDAFGDLREAGVSILTVGQYLRPTERHLPVVRYWAPGGVHGARGGGVRARASSTSPPARSCARSYHADEHVKQDRPGVGPVATAV